MTNTPIQGKAECADGACGDVMLVIVDRATQQVTYYIVKDTEDPPVERMVPANLVGESRAGVVYLTCTRAELSALPPYLVAHLSENYIPDYRYSMPYTSVPGGIGGSFDAPVTAEYAMYDQEQVPEGSVAVRPGMKVLATDGEVGELRELVVDPTSGVITHFLLVANRREGELGTTLPLSTIDHVDDFEGILLRLNRHQIDSLPAVPLRPSKHDGEFTTVEMIAIVYDDPAGAQHGLEFVKDLSARHILQVVHAAVLVKDANGTARIAAHEDLHKGRSRWAGALAGGMMGVLGGPVGIVVGAAAGFGAGAAVEGKVNKGFADPFIETLKERLQPGKSGLLLIVEHAWAKTAAEYLGQEHGVLTQQELTDRLAAQLLVANEGNAAPS